jgi:phage terminase large subunit-like protein
LRLARLPKADRLEVLKSLSDDAARALLYDWRGFWARPEQVAPTTDWHVWLLLAGRGFGKTRTGAEWIRERVEDTANPARRIALVARTAPDCRDVIVEGESGILAISPSWNRPKYEPSKRRLTWPNGAMATLYSADEPDLLRGPEHDTAWADELASWRYTAAWDNLQFGLRLGADPRVCVTTTPRPTPIIRDLVKDETTAVTRGSTYDNAANLPEAFFRKIIRKYRGTRLGRQEIEAQILEDAPGALWSHAQLDALRVGTMPDLRELVIAVDPATTSEEGSNETGLIVAGVGIDGHGYIIGDLSAQLTPDGWARRAVTEYRERRANKIVGESNQGGDMVSFTIETVARDMQVTAHVVLVHASLGKRTRAEPVSALYEQKRVHHVGVFPELEDQMCAWEPGVAKDSPDRMDALVWGLTELMVERDPKLERTRPAVLQSAFTKFGGKPLAGPEPPTPDPEKHRGTGGLTFR